MELTKDQIEEILDAADARQQKRDEDNKIREAATQIGYNNSRVIVLHYLGGKPIYARVSVELLDN